MEKRSTIRGFFANINNLPPIIVPFQWNPTEIKEARAIKYTDLEIGGYMAPIQIYSSGGATVYTFTLTIDATDVSKGANIFRVDVPEVGINSVISALKSFTYPHINSILRFQQDDVVGEPPACYFGLGPKVLRGRIRNLTVNYKLFNSLLVPLQATVEVEFHVDEYGIWSKINAVYRRIATAINPAVGGF